LGTILEYMGGNNINGGVKGLGGWSDNKISNKCENWLLLHNLFDKRHIDLKIKNSDISLVIIGHELIHKHKFVP
jgi:hypothetical protein